MKWTGLVCKSCFWLNSYTLFYFFSIISLWKLELRLAFRRLLISNLWLFPRYNISALELYPEVLSTGISRWSSPYSSLPGRFLSRKFLVKISNTFDFMWLVAKMSSDFYIYSVASLPKTVNDRSDKIWRYIEKMVSRILVILMLVETNKILTFFQTKNHCSRYLK